MQRLQKTVFTALISLGLFIWASSGFAVQVAGLYETKVPVASQSTALRANALKQALTQVLVKLSGSSTSVTIPSITAALAHPESTLLSYSYQDGLLPNGDDSLFLHASFDPKAIQQILENAGQSVWGRNRPLVLLWVSYSENQKAPQVLSSTSRGFIDSEVKYDAQLRGLPILFPVLDLTDMQTVSASAIADQNIHSIEQASARYGSDAILAANITETTPGNWNATWTLIAQGNTTTWVNNADNVKALLKTGLDTITDALAAKYVVVSDTSQQNEVQLTVINIQNLSDYAAVTDYLKSLLPVKQVELQQINPSALVYSVKVVGGEMGLQKALSLDHRLQAVTVAPSLDNAETGLVYQWAS